MSERTHTLKCWPHHFDAVAGGYKPFEVRINDRNYGLGDELILQRYDPERGHTLYPSGERVECHQRVTYVLMGGQFGIKPGYVVLGLAPIALHAGPKEPKP